MKECKELRDNVLDRVCHEHLVAVELDLVALDLYVVLDLREVEDTCEVERIVHIEVDVEQRLLCHRVKGSVELIIILILEVSRLAGPERLNFIDYVVLVSVYVLAVFPLLPLAEDHRNRHELAILAQEA